MKLSKKLFRPFSNPVNEIINRRQRSKQLANTIHGYDPIHQLQDYLYQKIPYDFKILGKYNSVATQRLIAILKYHQIYFEEENSPLLLKNIQYRYKDLKKMNDIQKWPAMLIEYNLNQSEMIIGQAKALEFFKKDFIRQYQHMTHTAWADQGQQFLKQKLQPTIQLLFSNPMLAIQNQRYKFKNNKHHGYDLFTLMRMQIISASLILIKNVPSLIFNRQQYFKVKNTLKALMKQWQQRIQNNQFHGGNKPDEADIDLYAIIMAKYNSPTFINFIQNQQGKFKFWLRRMTSICSYKYQI